jgi:hypothetical protein
LISSRRLHSGDARKKIANKCACFPLRFSGPEYLFSLFKLERIAGSLSKGICEKGNY